MPFSAPHQHRKDRTGFLEVETTSSLGHEAMQLFDIRHWQDPDLAHLVMLLFLHAESAVQASRSDLIFSEHLCAVVALWLIRSRLRRARR